MGSSWYYGRNGQQQGPFVLDQMREMVRNGELRPGDLVWTEGMEQWTEARTVGELFPPAGDASSGNVPPPPPPPPVSAPAQVGQWQPPHAVEYQGVYRPNYASPPPPNYLVQAILVTLFCCLPFGIVAIVYAAQVNGKHQANDVHGALDASNKARFWCWLSLALGLIPTVLWFVVVVAGSAARGF